MRLNLKKKSRRWLLATILVSAMVVCATLAVFSPKVSSITSVLNEHWNPYGHPPDYISKYPYSTTARRLTLYILLNNPSEEQLTEHICAIEKEWKLIPREQRARELSRRILTSYSHPTTP